ncbi:MAG: hypothetical protein V1743_06990 [Nanoarchaeota archaeon]
MKPFFALGILLCLLTTFASADNPGSIWTTKDDCGESQQDVNHYAIGETVWINGANFNADNYPWDITGQPGQASCDPNIVVASGIVTINETGAFCFAAYTVQNDDCGEYKVNVGNKNDNYHVDEQVIPEFGLLAGGIALIGALCTFFLLRKR